MSEQRPRSHGPTSSKMTSAGTFTQGSSSLQLSRDGWSLPQTSTQRRYYTPVTLEEQTGVHDVASSNDETSTSKIDSAVHGFINVNAPVTEQTTVNKVHVTKSRVIRPLGGIEYMYNSYTSKGADSVCLMTRIESQYPITAEIAQEAFVHLLRRHPMLRACIHPLRDGPEGEHVLVEHEPPLYDFDVLSRSDWMQMLLEMSAQAFRTPETPLIKCRMIDTKPIPYTEKIRDFNMSPKPRPQIYPRGLFGYQSTFLFIIHHSVMDGSYSLWMFQEFMNFVDAVAMGHRFDRVVELTVQPPVERVMLFSSDDNTDSAITSHQNISGSLTCSVKLCHDATQDQLLKDYQTKFSDEIRRLSSQEPRNGCQTFSLSKAETSNFTRLSKQNGCRPKGVLTTAWILALLELVYGEFTSVEIPMEYMIDFRRFCDISLLGLGVPQYPGSATMHVPLLVRLERKRKGPITSDEFWEMSKLFDRFLTVNIFSKEVFQWILDEAEKYRQNPLQPEELGKSQYVMCVSNLGLCDGAVHGDVSSRIRLTHLHGHSTVLVDDSPLFFTKTFTLNGKLCGNASFCETYTSNVTAMTFIALFKKYITSHSKL